MPRVAIWKSQISLLIYRLHSLGYLFREWKFLVSDTFLTTAFSKFSPRIISYTFFRLIRLLLMQENAHKRVFKDEQNI